MRFSIRGGGNITVKDKLDSKVDKEEGKGLFSGSYNDLTDKPSPMLQGEWWEGSDGTKNVDNAENNTTHFVYSSHGAPATGSLLTFGAYGRGNNYRGQILLNYYGAINGLYARIKNGDNGTWTSWEQLVVKSHIVTVTLTYNSTNGRFVYPNANIRKPTGGVQLCLPARNTQTGAIYLIWYEANNQNWMIAANVSGSAPSNGNTVTIQYFTI